MNIFALVFFLLSFERVHAFHEIAKQPPQTEFLKYPFEGVDDKWAPAKYLKEDNDCYAYFLRCIRYRTDFHAICALNIQTGYLEDFNNTCNIDFMNCQFRMWYAVGVVGYNYRDDLLLHNGEGRSCEFYLRTGGSPEAALRLYKKTIPMIVDKEELNGLRKEKMLRIFKGIKMNFNNDHIAKLDSAFIKEGEEIVKSHKGLKNIGLKNNMIPKIGSVPFSMRDETQNKIRKGATVVDPGINTKIESMLAKKDDKKPKVPNENNNDVKLEVNTGSKDREERMLEELILMNQKLAKLNQNMY